MDLPAPTPPIVCDRTGAPDTGPERLREYQRLFSQALIGREKTATGICFRLRAQPGTEAWVRDLAAREKACCTFFTFTITTLGEEMRWDATVIDDDIARAVLDEFYALPRHRRRRLRGRCRPIHPARPAIHRPGRPPSRHGINARLLTD
jgi:hypothetical protein